MPRRALPGLLAAAAVGACGGNHEVSHRPTLTTMPPPAAAAPVLRPADCPATAGYACATLDVPLRRAQPEGPRLRLAVARRRAGDAPRGVLVALSGGPGQPGRPFGPRLAQRLGRALDGFELVVLDQRGTGDQAIDCPALQRTVGASDVAAPPDAAVRSCAQGLDGRRDAYATADTVADLEDLRRALHAPKLTLLGVSYGTFVAERYALAHPATTRGLVLDSVVPQEGVELLQRVPLRATRRVLRAVCAKEAAPCAGDPARDLAAVATRSPPTAVPLFDAITELSIGVPRLDVLPPVLHRAARGDDAPLRRLLRAIASFDRAVPARFLSAGLHTATLCADSPAPWGSPAAPATARAAALAQVRDALRPAQTAPWPPRVALDQGLLRTCLAWPPVRAAAPPPASARIAAPALLLNGDRDLSTPLEWARAQARRMPRGRLMVLSGAGHSIITRDRANRAASPVGRFLRSLPAG